MNYLISPPIPDARTLVEDVLARATTTSSKSLLHGPSHWRSVAATGLALLEEVPEADTLVVFLFSLMHDSRRYHDGRDPHHGARAAVLARKLHDKLYFITAAQMGLLELALIEHDNGHTSDDPTVGVCWDSDRLNLWRCGIKPSPRLLSTPAAKEPKRIEWARGVRGRSLRWEDLARDYGLCWSA